MHEEKNLAKLTVVPQETLDALRQAMRNTRILCAVMLDTKVLKLT